MKKILLIALMIISFEAKAQTVNDKQIKDIDVKYLRIVGTQKLFSRDLTIQLDFGQNTGFWTAGSDTLVKDENGKAMSFNSMIDAMNFMSNFGYKFEAAYVITVGNQNVYHYLMSKI